MTRYPCFFSSKREKKKALQVALQAAKHGGAAALKFFRKNRLAVQKKADRSPVTRADRESEKKIRAILHRTFPDHRIIGEEFQAKVSSSPWCWWVDPIDGTRPFIRGIPTWSTLLALAYRNEPQLGVLFFPALRWTFWAIRGEGCFWNGRRCRVSGIEDIRNSTLLYGALRFFPKTARTGLVKLLEKVYDERGFGDAFAHALVAAGMAEAMFDPKVKPYDVAAVQVCIEEAGGCFSDFTGRRTFHGGSALSSNGEFHEKLLEGIR